MKKVILGKTGLQISYMGFGGIPLQRVTQQEAKEVFKALIEQGVNYLDTARAYTVSEEWIGRRHRRYARPVCVGHQIETDNGSRHAGRH